MHQREPNLVTSSLSRHITHDGVSVEICIYRLDTEPSWSLEVVNFAGTSTVSDDLFPTDEAAFAEFEHTVAEEGMVAFLDQAKVIPFRR